MPGVPNLRPAGHIQPSIVCHPARLFWTRPNIFSSDKTTLFWPARFYIIILYPWMRKDWAPLVYAFCCQVLTVTFCSFSNYVCINCMCQYHPHDEWRLHERENNTGEKLQILHSIVYSVITLTLDQFLANICQKSFSFWSWFDKTDNIGLREIPTFSRCKNLWMLRK